MSVFAKEYSQGIFIPEHKEKCYNFNGERPPNVEPMYYIIDPKPPTYRSSWEKKFMNFCDLNKNILRWGSETIRIPYYSPLDGKDHHYFTDFIMIVREKDNTIKRYIIEVKPQSQAERLDEHGRLILPDAPKKKTQKNLMKWKEKNDVIQRNHEKWTYARNWCKRYNYDFKVITEKELNIH
ncbi:MAG: hypothetical protein MJZ34_10665 [Paludibacteraceae bacterium]|nr:hypothetical protein [Paludibacteraceae bacterium]